MNDSSPSRSVLRRQYLVLAGVGTIIAGSAAIAVYLGSTGHGHTQPPSKPVTTSILAPGAQVDPRDAWRGQADAQLKALEDSSRETGRRSGEVEARSRDLQERLDGDPLVGREHADRFGHVEVAHDAPASCVDVSDSELAADAAGRLEDRPGVVGLAALAGTGLPGFGVGPQTNTVRARSIWSYARRCSVSAASSSRTTMPSASLATSVPWYRRAPSTGA